MRLQTSEFLKHWKLHPQLEDASRHQHRLFAWTFLQGRRVECAAYYSWKRGFFTEPDTIGREEVTGKKHTALGVLLCNG